MIKKTSWTSERFALFLFLFLFFLPLSLSIYYSHRTHFPATTIIPSTICTALSSCGVWSHHYYHFFYGMQYTLL